jgi:hypothetical protein
MICHLVIFCKWVAEVIFELLDAPPRDMPEVLLQKKIA